MLISSMIKTNLNSYDIWNDYELQSYDNRHNTMAFTMSIPGICTKQSFGISEFSGFNQIQSSTHELGHTYRKIRS